MNPVSVADTARIAAAIIERDRARDAHANGPKTDASRYRYMAAQDELRRLMIAAKKPGATAPHTGVKAP